MEYASSTLQPLRDVGGVQGSMLLGVGDRVVSIDWPILSSENLAALVERQRVLIEAIDEGFELPEIVVLEFEGFRLFVRRFGEWSLLALVSPKTNLDALKMACTLLLRRAARGQRVDDPASGPLAAAPVVAPDRSSSRDPIPTPRSGTLPPPPMQTAASLPSSLRIPLSPPLPSGAGVSVRSSASPRSERTSVAGPPSGGSKPSPDAAAKKKKKKSDIWG